MGVVTNKEEGQSMFTIEFTRSDKAYMNVCAFDVREVAYEVANALIMGAIEDDVRTATLTISDTYTMEHTVYMLGVVSQYTTMVDDMPPATHTQVA